MRRLFLSRDGTAGTRREDADEICQALCPAAPTRLFTLRGSEIENAVSTEGETYDELENAFLYRKRYDPGAPAAAPETDRARDRACSTPTMRQLPASSR